MVEVFSQIPSHPIIALAESPTLEEPSWWMGENSKTNGGRVDYLERARIFLLFLCWVGRRGMVSDRLGARRTSASSPSDGEHASCATYHCRVVGAGVGKDVERGGGVERWVERARKGQFCAPCNAVAG